jgi:hypothetical protein
LQHKSKIPRSVHRLRVQEAIWVVGQQAAAARLSERAAAADGADSGIAFKNSEQPGTGLAECKAILDIYCESETGEKFIVELQKAKQNYFKDRTVF